jgi:hypothetical protein
MTDLMSISFLSSVPISGACFHAIGSDQDL